MVWFAGRVVAVLLLMMAGLLAEPRAEAYSLLTHEQLIDLTWRQSIVPLLLSRYPGLTPAELERARAYAYGGCMIQDIGYYPFGDEFFSNLTHYVRTGDFVVNLFRDAQNANELAFAVGALSHYLGDSVGHAGATNVAVPIEFPKLRARYGPVVSYAEGEHQHVQTEFAFDIDQIAHHRFAPVRYLRHVGLEVPTRQVALAFYQTYGLGEDFSAHRARRVNVRGYRFAVRSFIPRIAFAVTLLQRGREPADMTGDPEFQRLEQRLTAVAAENHWDQYRGRAGVGTYALAGLLYVLPKVGPIKLAAVKGPTDATERAYVHSVVASTDRLNAALRRFTPPPPPRADATGASAATGEALPQNDGAAEHPLTNRDLDTGAPVKPGGYRLTDATYASLLHRLAAAPTVPIPPGIKVDILAYYADPEAPISTRRDPQRWAVVQQDLVTLRTMPTTEAPVPFATYGAETPAE